MKLLTRTNKGTAGRGIHNCSNTYKVFWNYVSWNSANINLSTSKERKNIHRGQRRKFIVAWARRWRNKSRFEPDQVGEINARFAVGLRKTGNRELGNPSLKRG